jgi:lambda repressor-like predicted transcriptional regulator
MTAEARPLIPPALLARSPALRRLQWLDARPVRMARARSTPRRVLRAHVLARLRALGINFNALALRYHTHPKRLMDSVLFRWVHPPRHAQLAMDLGVRKADLWPEERAS